MGAGSKFLAAVCSRGEAEKGPRPEVRGLLQVCKGDPKERRGRKLLRHRS